MKTCLVFIMIFIISPELYAQELPSHPCGTDEFNRNRPRIQEFRQMPAVSPAAGPAILTIPVVVHVIYNSAGQNISDAQVQSQIDVLNEDFRKLNSDTNNVRNIFKSLAQDAGVQFCLAQRDPSGNATNGITRTATSVVSWGCNDSMMYSSNGGHDSWPEDRYLNIFVCNLNCANGFATLPGGPVFHDAIVVHYYVMGRTGNVAPGHIGRTGTHEVGHWLGLYHPFYYGSCAGNDTASCASAGDYICDTPADNYPSFGCDTLNNDCTDYPTDLPDQIENFMEYADDDCRVMFSADQVHLMQDVIYSYRNNLFLATGCVPPGVSIHDAILPEITEPSHDICTSNIPFSVKLGNAGTDPLTSLDIYYQVDLGSWNLYPWSGNLASGAWTTVTLPPLMIVQPGIHQLSVYSAMPNGQNDQNPANNTCNTLFTSLTASDAWSGPFTEDFENAAFPPHGWYIENPDLDKAWERSVDASGFGSGIASAMFDNFYNGGTGTLDRLVTGKVNLLAGYGWMLSFDVAYAQPLSPFYSDTLRVKYSLDCGYTWTLLWVMGGGQLATAPAPAVFGPFIPDSTQWAQHNIDLSALAGTDLLTFCFENRSGWSNNIFLDNINLAMTTSAEEHEKPAFRAYPNPALGELNIHGNGNFMMRINDAGGKTVWQGYAADQYKVDISGMERGYYILTVWSNDHLQHIPLVFK